MTVRCRGCRRTWDNWVDALAHQDQWNPYGENKHKVY